MSKIRVWEIAVLDQRSLRRCKKGMLLWTENFDLILASGCSPTMKWWDKSEVRIKHKLLVRTLSTAPAH
jgi:hypothetical protein